MSDVSDRLAKPGDPDLDCDIEGVVLSAVVREGDEFILRGSGGAGRWIDATTGRMVEVARVTEWEAVHGMVMEPGYEHVVDELHGRLEAWRMARVPLRYTSAPGRWAVLSNPVTGMAVPLPRSK